MKLSTTEKLEVLSHAVDIAAGEDAIRVFYVDIGNVIDKVADEYIQKLKQMNVNNSRGIDGFHVVKAATEQKNSILFLVFHAFKLCLK